MCTAKPLAIKSVSDYAPKFGFLPCNSCHDCRLVQQFSWSARLRLAVQAMEESKFGCQVGFVTLTYNDLSVPHIPDIFYRNDYVHTESGQMCFSKEHARSFIKSCRDFLLKVYGIHKPTYLLASEFGEHTQRPHYHAVFALPRFVGSSMTPVNMELFYNFIRDYWTKTKGYGFICPKEFSGSAKHGIKPFVATVNSATVCYCAKYACKDLAYYDYIDKSHLFKSVEVGEEIFKLSDYLPFHMQTRSLGVSYLDGLKSSEALKLLTDGFSFVGESKLHSLPKYYRNKILFDNYYIVEDDRRLCRRRPTEFFQQHYKEVYDHKVKQLEEVIERWSSFNYWYHLNVDPSSECFRKIFTVKNFLNLDSNTLAKYYLSYFGVPRSVCVVFVPLDLFWFNRYCDSPLDYAAICKDDFVYSWESHILESTFYDNLTAFFVCCHALENDLMHPVKSKALAKERETNRVRDFHNCEKGF